MLYLPNYMSNRKKAIKTIIVSTILHFPAVTAAVTAPVPEMLPFFLRKHHFFFTYPSVSFCMVHLFLLKPLISNFLQFLEEALTVQCIGVIP